MFISCTFMTGRHVQFERIPDLQSVFYFTPGLHRRIENVLGRFFTSASARELRTHNEEHPSCECIVEKIIFQ